MTTMKTSELADTALDWAVSRCEEQRTGVWATCRPSAYSSYWGLGGPIIEREKVHLFQQESTNEWTASLPRGHKVGWRILQYGPTPLIAAMRCYVASKLGDEVEIPIELQGATND